MRQARAAALLLSWCRRALAHGGLVATAHALHTTLGLERDELEMLRLPVDLLDRFPRWRSGSRAGFTAPARFAALDAAGAALPLGPVRLQLTESSGAARLVLPLLRGLESALDADVPITVLTDPGKAGPVLRRLGRAVLRDAGRVRFETGRSATAYARDHALAAHRANGDAVLLVPRGAKPHRGKEDPALDARAARRTFGVTVRRSLLYWEGGNILFDGHRALVGADLVRENMARLGLAKAEVIAILEAEWGVRVAVLGSVARARFDATQDVLSRSGQASYHIDLDICPLGRSARGRPVVMLTDPQLGLRVLRRVLGHPRLADGHGLPSALGRRLLEAEYRRVAAERRPLLAAYRRQLERLGYEVRALPELRVDTEHPRVGLGNLDFSYANALPALHRGRPGVYYLPWGIPSLDALAERQWRGAGVVPVAIAEFAPLAHGMMELAAGLHCFVGAVPAPRAVG